MIPKDYVEKVYSGWLGKVIGVRLGAPVEGWTYDKIKEEIGEITGYVKDYKMFAADDDTNGPMIFIRALEDYALKPSAEDIGKTWLNYIGDGHGTLWWGGYGISTEHTAYLNLLHGIKAPYSGCMELNGSTVAEQIGGQIFIDVWGLIAPGNPQLAAQYAEKAASVSHDGNGKYGGMFIAACIAEAFVETDIKKIIEAGLSVIPSDCQYARMVKDIVRFYDENPDDWRKCYEYIRAYYGYDRYPGNCHIIPNAAVIVLSLLYGGGDFSKTICICNMCGWDTDCNVGNVGCIMGVKCGLEGIPYYWREPINDVLINSTLIGDINIMDIPSVACYIANLGYAIAGESVPDEWKEIITTGHGMEYHFEFPGSTHGFRSDSPDIVLENNSEISYKGKRCLKIILNGLKSARVYHKTYYRPEDFDDDRYSPDFSPALYPGYGISCYVMASASEEFVSDITARLYVRDANGGKIHYGPPVILTSHQWTCVSFDIPHMDGVCLDAMGIEINSDQPVDCVYIDEVKCYPTPDYTLDFSKEKMETWSFGHVKPSQLTYLRGIWVLEDGELSGSGYDNCESYTGSRKWTDYTLEGLIKPLFGSHHNINFRVWGAMRSYAAGLAPGDRIALYKNIEGNYVELASHPFSWEMGREYRIKVDAIGNEFKVYIDDHELIRYRDDDNPYMKGQVGFSNIGGGHTHYRYLTVKHIKSI